MEFKHYAEAPRNVEAIVAIARRGAQQLVEDLSAIRCHPAVPVRRDPVMPMQTLNPNTGMLFGELKWQRKI